MNARYANTCQAPTRAKRQCVLGSDTHVMKWQGMSKGVKVCQRVPMHVQECLGVLGQHKGALGQNA